MIPVPDVARVRLDNAMRLFDEFVQATIKSPDAATLRGLERRFAERLQIQPSYWSQIKGRSRQIGERLARQFEQQCRKPVGWMDMPAAAAGAPTLPAPTPAASMAALPASQPQDDDERFIVGLVLTYYRRHPERARSRLLGLLGEVLTPQPDAPNSVLNTGFNTAPNIAPNTPAASPAPPPAAARKLAPGVTRRPAASAAQPAPDDDLALWARTRAAIAPLKGSGKRKP